jgi:SAM-dependent methyltransferase
MTVWSDGYNADTAYVHGFYRELSPDYLAYTCLVNGVRPPRVDRPFRYLELGCGQGLTLNILAATHADAHFVGVDFNPLHIAGARRLADNAQLTNIDFLEASFRDYADRSLGHPAGQEDGFDFIVLHGVYSWISRENRQAVVDILSRRLNPGGVVYIGYNCLPGWSVQAPLQKLMLAYAAAHPGSSEQQIAGAFDLMRQLGDGDGRYFSANPAARSVLDSLAVQDRRYLAHEYLNRYWEPLSHAEVVADLLPAKLDYAGSAILSANYDDLSVTEPLKPLMAGIADPALKETLRDYISNQKFRRDVFVRGLERMPAAETAMAWRGLRFTLVVPREDAGVSAPIPLGEIHHEEGLALPVLDALAAGTPSLGEIAALPQLAGHDFAYIARFIALQVSGARAHLLSPMPSRAATARLNRVIAERTRFDDAVSFVAADAIGGGALLSNHDRLMLAGLYAGLPADPSVLAGFVADALVSLGRHVIVSDGTPVHDAAGIQVQMTGVLRASLARNLGVWQRIGVIGG